MKFKKLCSTVLAAAMCISAQPPVQAQETAQLVDSGINYTECTETINNPAAGYTSPLWYSCKPGNTPVYNPTGNLVLLLVDIGGFSSGVNGVTDEEGNYTPGVDYDLDETFFRNFRQTLDHCRRNGSTIAIRFRYDANGYTNPEPATYEKMVEHIEQIRADGFLEDYKDIIAYVETGFVGSWGEHWGGKYCSMPDKAKLVDILLDVVPKEIPITVRTPLTFATWAGIEESELGEYISEPGSDASRIGLYNDGYMGSDSDLGTYHDRERDTTWLGRQAVTTYFGGEFSGNLEFTKQYETYLPENAIPEMYKTHLSYINSNIYQLYKDYIFGEQYDVEDVDNSAYYGETVFKFMRDHLGYRFVIRDSDLSAQVEQGEILTLRADIENTGFANPIMAQKAELILEKDGNYIRTDVDIDTRKWYSRTTATPEFQMKIPGGLETGEWNVYLKLSIGNNTIDQMHMRSVHFANDGVWNPALGANYFGSFTVTKGHDAAKLADGSFYQVNAEQDIARSDGEMFNYAQTCAADGFVTSSYETSEETLCVEDGEKRLYLASDDKYLYITADIAQNAIAPVYNLQIKNADTGKFHWLYYQGNGFIYFNGGQPYGCVHRHNGSIVEFRIPFGEIMGLGAGVKLENVRVSIQDEKNSWVNVGEVNSGEYTIPDNIPVYSAKRTLYGAKDEPLQLQARTTADGLSYQWMFDGKPVDGADTAQLNVEQAAVGVYSVKITSPNGAEKIVEICEVAEIAAEIRRGDVNLDGSVTTADAVLLQKYLLALEPLSENALQAAELCEDKTVNAFDLAVLKRMLLMKKEK